MDKREAANALITALENFKAAAAEEHRINPGASNSSEASVEAVAFVKCGDELHQYIMASDLVANDIRDVLTRALIERRINHLRGENPELARAIEALMNHTKRRAEGAG